MSQKMRYFSLLAYFFTPYSVSTYQSKADTNFTTEFTKLARYLSLVAGEKKLESYQPPMEMIMRRCGYFDLTPWFLFSKRL